MLETTTLTLRNPPIVEAVIDINCDLPPNFDLGAVQEQAHEALRSQYPEVRKGYRHEARVEIATERPANLSMLPSLQSLQFRQADGCQVVQFRTQGYSFNRLAPYTRLTDYLPEIQRTWIIMADTCHPVFIRNLRLRYINRFLLPSGKNTSDLPDYLRLSSQLPASSRLVTQESLQHLRLQDEESDSDGVIVLKIQPVEEDRLPIILDIAVGGPMNVTPPAWETIISRMAQLRELKNRLFSLTLQESCLQLFR